MKILGLSFFYHDSAAALIIDGIPVALTQEERFSRKKNDASFPSKAIEFVLNEGKIIPSELDYVVFYEKPFWKFDRIIKSLLVSFPSNPKIFNESLKHLFLDKLWIRLLIAKELKIKPEKIFFSEHHLSHAASSFFCSPYQESAILTVDGVGEWTATAIGVGRENEIKILKEIHFPHSLGLLYSAFTAFLGFEVNEGEYKVMGMAPYGQPKYVDKIKKLIRIFDDGSYELNLSYFSFHHSLEKTYSEKFVKLFGQPRDLKSKFFTRETGWPSYFGEKPEKIEYEKLAQKQEYYADVASSIQAVLEEVLIRLTNTAFKLTGLKKLCLAGGVALNSVANFKILQNTLFEEIFIQPAAGDAGAALGAALAFYHLGLGEKRQFVMDHVYFGKNYPRVEIEKFILLENPVIWGGDGYNPSLFSEKGSFLTGFIQENNLNDKAKLIENEEELLDKATDYLIEGKVIGWFDGKFEWGPRALGSRSILADPRRAEMKDIVNTKIKFREPYRPFCPSVLAEKSEEFFEVSQATKHFPLRFMLYVVKVKEEKRKLIPAVTHIDGTARPQLVYKETSPRYYKLISKFYEKTGIPLILNTSFNLKGEPIVNSPEDAFSTFMKSEMDILILGNYLIQK